MKRLGIYLFASIMFYFSPAYAFETLHEIKNYCTIMPENPDPTITKWHFIDFSKIYEKNQPSWLKTITDFFGITKKLSWTPEKFEKQLKQIVSQRQEKKITKKMITGLCTSDDTHIVIWGVLHAALHSFTRCLEWLEKQGIIDNNLRIIKPNYYLVMNGDLIDRSPYSLEILSIAFELLYKNPEHVIYLKGEHETDNYWHNFNTKRALQFYFPHVYGEEVPLDNFMDDFFDTLPLGLYLMAENNPSSTLRISPLGRSSKLLDEDYYGTFFEDLYKNKNHIMYYDLEQRKLSSQKINIPTLITTEDWLVDNRTQTGLGQLNPEFGSTTWAFFSCPTPPYQLHFDFFYDAFGIIDIHQELDKTIINLHHQDVRTLDGFKLYAQYNALSSQLLPAGDNYSSANNINIGSSMGLEKGPLFGKQTNQTLSLKINEQNQDFNGINGNHLRLYVSNDNYIPYLARRNIIEFTQQNIKTMLTPVGSPTLSAYLDFAQKNNLAILFPVSGSAPFRAPEFTSIINLRASYLDEIQVILKVLIKEYGVRKIAFFYIDDGTMIDTVKTAHEILKKHGITEWIDVPHSRAATNFREQADKIKAAQPDAIGFLSQEPQSKELIRQIGIDMIVHSKLFAISSTCATPFKNFVKKIGLSFLYSNVVPDPFTSELQIAQEFRALLNKKWHYNYSLYAFEAFIATNVLIDALEHLEAPYTSEKIIKLLESYKDYSLKGLNLTFNPKTRTLLQSVWLDTDSKNNKFIEYKLTP